MTDNYLLLYHLAECMLKHQQHYIAVDELFDDEVISDFVKSIQIDSPYQQMLHQGVLTESVRDEKLYISFTVEGYFHFVLGEVIFDHSKDKEYSYFITLLENNQLNFNLSPSFFSLNGLRWEIANASDIMLTEKDLMVTNFSKNSSFI